MLRLLGLPKLILILSHLFNIHGREPYWYDFAETNFNFGLYSDIYRPISFKLRTMIENTKLHFYVSLDDLYLHSRSQLYEKSKPVSIFSEMLLMTWMKLIMLPQPVGLSKLRLNLICTSTIQRRELCRRDFTKFRMNIILCQDTGELICFKLGMMLDTT